MNKQVEMTFKELYLREKDKPTPAQSFIEDVAELTGRSTTTIRQWLSGAQTPEINTQKLIAAKYKVSLETLFPMQETYRKEVQNGTC